MIERLHNTYNKAILTGGRTSPQKKGDMKPFGLWYSLGNEWLEWCSDNMPDWVYENTFSLEIDEKKILIISTIEELEEFVEMYSYKQSSHFYCIDWGKIAAHWSGIKIRNYHKLNHRGLQPFMAYTWLYGWDVSAGCIWDLSVIKTVKKLEVMCEKT